MDTFFLCCMVGGLVIPVLDVLFGAVGGFCGLDLDFDGSADLDSPLPVNIMSISFSVVVFGAAGKLLLRVAPAVVSVAAALCAGLLGGWAIGRFVLRPLRASNPRAHGIRDTLWQEGVVKLGVRRDFVGTVTVHSATGSLVTYSAKPACWVSGELPVGSAVLVTAVDDEKQICTVCPAGGIGLVERPVCRGCAGLVTVYGAAEGPVTYSAAPAPFAGEEIPAGSAVLLTHIDGAAGACTVCPVERTGLAEQVIRGDSAGSVTVHSAAGNPISYRARPAPGAGEEIPAGSAVFLVTADEGRRTCTVCPLDMAEIRNAPPGEAAD